MRGIVIAGSVGLWATMAAMAGPAMAAPAAQGEPAAYAAAMATAKQRSAAKDRPGAVAALNEALKARPDDPTALSELSWASFLTGDFATAEQAGERAAGLATQPAHKAMAFYNAGHAEEAQGKLRAAEIAYKYSLVYRDNPEVKARLAGLGAALVTPRPMIGPFAAPDGFCQAHHLSPDVCEVTLDIDDKRDGEGQQIVDDAGHIAHIASAPFTSVAKVLTEPDPQTGYADMNLAIQVGARWYVLPGVGAATGGHGGGYGLEVHMVGHRLVIGWTSSLGRFSHADEAATIVCGVGASGAPTCVGPLLTEQSETTDYCAKDLDCRKQPTMLVDFHCRATLRGDVLEIDRNPAKIENPEEAELLQPSPGACAALPYSGKHRLVF